MAKKSGTGTGVKQQYYSKNRERLIAYQKRYNTAYAGRAKRLEAGDHVRHKRYGPGVVLEEWGSWHTCTGCHNEIPMQKLKGGKAWCRKCQEEAAVQQIGGDGVFDVLFVSGVRSINEVWLKRDVGSRMAVVKKVKRAA